MATSPGIGACRRMAQALQIACMASPPLRFLKTFQLAARRGSFKAAADALCITASAVSHQIKTLEDQLGLVLFNRHTRSLTLTPAGAYYLEHIEAAFGRLESATEHLRSRFTREVVRLQVPPFFASEMLLPRLACFSALHADTDIRIATHGSPYDMSAADCDLEIVVSDGRWADVRAVALFAQAYVPACSPSLLTDHPIDATGVMQQALIVHHRRPDLWDRWAAMAGIRLLRPRQMIHFDTMSAAVHAAEQGVGVAMVSLPLAAARFRAGTLRRLSDDVLQTGESYFLVTRSADADRKGVAQLSGWMLEQFAGGGQDEASLAQAEN